MFEVGIKKNYEKGDVVFCIISVNSNLTLGADYTISQVRSDGTELEITTDSGYKNWYNAHRFLSKKEERNIKIDKILE